MRELGECGEANAIERRHQPGMKLLGTFGRDSGCHQSGSSYPVRKLLSFEKASKFLDRKFLVFGSNCFPLWYLVVILLVGRLEVALAVPGTHNGPQQSGKGIMAVA